MRKYMIRTSVFFKKKCKFAILIRMNLNLLKMKKLLFSIIAIVLMASSVTAQNVAKKFVLLEDFTGVRCPACPAANAAIEKMVDEGLSIIPLAFHCELYSSDFATSETDSRGSNFYKVSGYPTVVIDGETVVGSYYGSKEYVNYAYAYFKPIYDENIQKDSPFSLELSFDGHVGGQPQVKATVKKVGECDEKRNVRVFMALVESHINYSWQGFSEVNHCVRDIITPASGVKIKEDTQEVTALFDITPYKKENCEIVAWVQATEGGKEVFQADKISIGTTAAAYDLGIVNVEEAPVGVCSGKIAPRFTILNCGTEKLTSALFKITDDNNNEIGRYNWEGNLSPKVKDEFIIPEFNIGNVGSIRIEAMELNGDKEDEYTIDNVFKLDVVAPYQLPDDGLLNFQIKTDVAKNFTVDVINMSKNELVKTITIPENNKLLKENYVLPEYGCYRIVFKNSKGLGAGENSLWGVLDGNKKTIASGKTAENVFKYNYIVELSYGTEGVEDIVVKDAVVYPNPAKSVINVYAENLNRVTAFNSIGQMVYTEVVNGDNIMIDVASWTNGLYYINLETKDGAKSSQKVVVNK